ncbi:MAG: biotin transporter BioY [Sulfolobales archaeon]
MGSLQRYVLMVFGASTITVGAWLKFNVGPVPYTFQNFGVVLTSLVLSPTDATSSVLLYIIMIALGLPVGAGFRGGPHLLFGYTGGYIWGFLLSAPIVSALAKLYLRSVGRNLDALRSRDVAILTAIASVGMFPTYILGYLVFRCYALSSKGLLDWARAASGFFGLHGSPEMVVLFAAVLAFLPQDVLMDHLLAVLAAKRVYALLLSRGVNTSEGCARQEPVNMGRRKRGR